MRNRLWLLAGAALAILLVAATATATTKVGSKAQGASSAAAPFAQSWAQVPRTHGCSQGEGHPRLRPGAGHRRLQHRT